MNKEKLELYMQGRSSRWPKFSKGYLKGKICAVCGGKKNLQAHHKKPFHLFPDLELDPANVIPLCEGAKDVNCHLFIGHLGNFKGYNPDVEADAREWNRKLEENKKRIQGTNKWMKGGDHV